MPKVAFKRGMISIGVFILVMISLHFFITTSKIDAIKEIFNSGERVVCENNMRRKTSESVLISQDLGWKLDGDKFRHEDYERDFHTSRCI